MYSQKQPIKEEAAREGRKLIKDPTTYLFGRDPRLPTLFLSLGEKGKRTVAGLKSEKKGRRVEKTTTPKLIRRIEITAFAAR